MVDRNRAAGWARQSFGLQFVDATCLELIGPQEAITIIEASTRWPSYFSDIVGAAATSLS